MNKFCWCFSVRAGTILIALLSIIFSLPFVYDIFQYWNNPELPLPNQARKGVQIKCSSNNTANFEFFIPAILSNELGNILVVAYFCCSLSLLYGAFMRKQSPCIPWLWLTFICYCLHLWTAIFVMVQSVLFRSCHLSTKLHSLIAVLLVYMFEDYLISTITSFCEQLDQEITSTDQSDQQNTINNLDTTVQQPNDTIVPPSIDPHLQTVPEVVICPNSHLDLPPSYEEVVRPTAPSPN